jgi:hypothetical protein
MEKNKFKNALISAAIVTSLLLSALPGSAQRGGSGGGIKTDTRITYHNGPIMTGTPTIYLIWYGNWSGNDAVSIMDDLAASTSGTPYFMINTTYTNALGDTPSGGTLYAGSVWDNYSHGPSLTVDDIREIIVDKMNSSELPLDANGIYIVLGSADATDIQPDGSTFCTPGKFPYHAATVFDGTSVKYGYIGSPDRCPTSAAPQFVAADGSRLPTPNGNFAADGMASIYLHLLNVIVTNSSGYGWYDRNGLENAAKCVGQFGSTYATSNGARANMRMGGRDYLIQANWINDRKGRCTVSIAN